MKTTDSSKGCSNPLLRDESGSTGSSRDWTTVLDWPPLRVFVPYYELEDEDRSTVTEVEFTSLEKPWLAKTRIQPEIKTPEYWQIHKLAKYFKTGDQTSTAVTLAMLSEFDYSLKSTQFALLDTGIIEIIINLLETNDLRCQLGAFSILEKVSKSGEMQYHLINYGIMPLLLSLAANPARDLQRSAVAILCDISSTRLARTIIRKYNGISILLDLLDVPGWVWNKKPEDVVGEQRDISVVARIGLDTIMKLCRSPPIRRQLHHAGLFKILTVLLESPEKPINLCGITIVNLCASLDIYRESFEAERLLKCLKRHISSSDTTFQELCCRIIYKMSCRSEAREQVLKFELIDDLVRLIKDESKPHKLLKYAAGSLHRLAKQESVLKAIDEMGILSPLVRLLSHPKVSVSAEGAGVLSELAVITSNREGLRRLGAIGHLMRIIEREHDAALLTNSILVLKECSYHEQCFDEMNEYNPLKLMWSLLRHPAPSVRANAAWALAPLIKRVPDSSELIRSYSRGIEFLVDLLDDPELEVAAGTCAAIAYLGNDDANLNIISELGVVAKLSDLTLINNDILRENVCAAIATLSRIPKNSFELGRRGAIAPVVRCLSSDNMDVRTAAAFALWKLSTDPVNCITMHKSGVVPILVECLGLASGPLQASAAGCLTNMRGLAHEADQLRYIGIITAGPRIRKSFKSKSVVQAIIEHEIEEQEKARAMAEAMG